MDILLLLLLCLVVYKTIKPSGKLHNFDSDVTLPLRGILAVFIIVHHTALSYSCSDDAPLLINVQSWSISIFKDMGCPVVGVFFLLSGYGLAKSLSYKGKSYLSGFLSKRMKKILPELLFLTVLVTISYIILGIKSPEEFIDNISRGIPPLAFSWFMYAIIYAYITFYLAAVISKANLKLTGILFSGFIGVYIFIVGPILHWAGWWYITIPAIPIGYFVALYENKITNLLSRHIFVITGLLLVIALLGSHWLLSQYIRGTELIEIYSLVVLTYIVVRLYGFPRWNVLLWLGGISLNIYLVHGAILEWTKVAIIHPLVTLVAVIILSCLFAYALKKLRNYLGIFG